MNPPITQQGFTHPAGLYTPDRALHAPISNAAETFRRLEKGKGFYTPEKKHRLSRALRAYPNQPVGHTLNILIHYIFAANTSDVTSHLSLFLRRTVRGDPWLDPREQA